MRSAYQIGHRCYVWQKTPWQLQARTRSVASAIPGVATQKSQQKVKADNLQKQYSTDPRTPKVQSTRGITTKPTRVHRFGTKRVSSTRAQKWVVDPNDQPFIGPLNQGEDEPQRSYIPLLTTKSPVTVFDTIDQIDRHPYNLMKYEVNNYVLSRFPQK